MTRLRYSSNREALEALLVRSGYAERSEEARRLAEYAELLAKWNARVNLTAATDWNSLEPLFEEAIWAAGMYPADPIRHLDIGSGAGFPALVMRILRPRMRLTMVEPRGKRAAFLETAAHELGLRDSAVFNGRLDEFLDSVGQEGWDLVSWKALKLGRPEAARLLSRSGAETEFWVFHGARLPLDEALMERFRLIRREDFARKRSWFLSVLRKNVSCET